MKTRFLLPHKFKKVGWLMLIPSTILGLLVISNNFEPHFLKLPVFVLYMDRITGEDVYFSIIETNIANELVGILFLMSAMLVSFSKAKNEDEYITKIRLESLVWATYANYAILLLALILVFGFGFLTFMVINMFTLLILFIIKFNFALYKSKRG